MCNNTNVISLSKNPIQHLYTKHIEVRHHFLRAHMLKSDIILEFINKEHSLQIFLQSYWVWIAFVKYKGI